MVLKVNRLRHKAVLFIFVCGIYGFIVMYSQSNVLNQWSSEINIELPEEIVNEVKIKTKPENKSDINKFGKAYNRGVQLINEVIQIHQSEDFAFDVLSIGNKNHSDLLQAQSHTWGDHHLVRNFYAATESDSDFTCLEKIKTYDQASRHAGKCRSRKFYQDLDVVNDVTGKFRNTYAGPTFLKEKANPAGWVCAQTRPPYALSKLLSLYREAHKTYGDDILPRYLILSDDDTFIDISILNQTLLATTDEKDNSVLYPHPNIPAVFAGCRVRHPIHETNFTFPFGGFGLFFSRGALLRMIQPLYCNTTSSETRGFEQEACERINDKNAISIGERDLFKPGMSISDLMGLFVSSNSFCQHSDWMTGYFVNFYNISRHVPDDGVWFNQESRMENVAQARLHVLDSESEIYRTNQSPGNCGINTPEKCTKKNIVCHRLSVEDMKKRHAMNSLM